MSLKRESPLETENLRGRFLLISGGEKNGEFVMEKSIL